METKLSKCKNAFDAGDFKTALKIAAAFPQLGAHRNDIKRGYEAYVHPDFYRQLGKNPDSLIATGISALSDRFGWL